LGTGVQIESMPAETNVIIAGTSVKRNIIGNNTVYFIVEKDNYAATLAAFLDSTAVRVFLQTFSAKARGGWFSHFS
jgi:hypothetical protein